MECHDWSKYVRIDASWINKYLQQHEQISNNKMIVRCFTLKFAGNLQRDEDFIKFISKNIIRFVYSDSDIREIEDKGDIPYQEALDYFGHVDPVRDGKYGELILFLFVEALFKAPLIAHKMKNNYPNDQQKGSDGLFIGTYSGNSALFIGESKFNKAATSGVTEALESLNRFHGDKNSYQALSHDLKIARECISKDLTQEDLDYLYSCLNPQELEFKSNILVHPVLIICDEATIDQIELASQNNSEAEEQMLSYIKKRIVEYHNNINKKLNENHSELKKVYIDFLFVPMKDIAKFRHSLYYSIHKVPFNMQEAQ
jgi:hypothetical protein